MPGYHVDEFTRALDRSRIAATFVITGNNDEGSAQEVVILLSAGVPVEGRVETSTGSAAVVAELCLLVRGDAEPRQGLMRTDSEGRFRFPDLAVGTRLYAYQFDGHLRSHEVTITASKEPVILKLRKALGSVKGRVVDSARNPIAGARVRVGKTHGGMGLVSMRTDADGRFGPVWLPSSATTLLVQHPGKEPWAALVEVSEGMERDLDIELDAGWQLEGRVLKDSGEPSPGVRVEARGHGRPSASTVTDRDGRFRFECLPEGRITLEVRATPGWRYYSETVRGLAGETQTRDVRRTRSGQIRLEVVDGRGRPLRDWVVHGRPTDDEKNNQQTIGRVDDDGFVVLDTRPEAHYRIQIQPDSRKVIEVVYRDGSLKRFVARGHEPLISWSHRRIQGKDLGIDELPGTVDQLRITIPDHFLPTARLRARFVDSSSKPVQGYLWIALPKARGWLTRTDEDGRVDTGLLMPGEYSFRFERDGSDKSDAVPLDLTELLPNQVIDLGNIRVDV